MNDLQVFKHQDFGELEIWHVDGKELFPATECAKILGYANPRDAISTHCKGVVKRDVIENSGFGVHTVEKNYISEGDLYRLIIRSKLPAAEKFESWIFDEVLPSIRKTGEYSMQTQKTDKLKENLEIFKVIQGSLPKKALPQVVKQLFGVEIAEPNKLAPRKKSAKEIKEERELMECRIRRGLFTSSDVGTLLGISALEVGKLTKKHAYLRGISYAVYSGIGKGIDPILYTREAAAELKKILGRRGK